MLKNFQKKNILLRHFTLTFIYQLIEFIFKFRMTWIQFYT